LKNNANKIVSQDLRSFKPNLNIGATKLTHTVWYFINIIFFKSSIPFPSSLKTYLLKLFGAKIGLFVRFKPCINIKFPWKLKIGNFCWIGEGVWIDNLDFVTIEDHVCISQGAYLLTGNHDYKKSTFDLITKPIVIESGTWIGAKSIVCPGVICYTNSILTVGSIATRNLEANFIYAGNPAVKCRERKFEC